MKISAAIFAIGEELLEGSVVDTNSSYIAGVLRGAGVEIKLITILQDNIDVLVQSIKEGVAKYDLIVTTGGLGPTFDDLTAAAIAQACGVDLRMYDEARDNIVNRLTKLGVAVNESHMRQAMLPDGATLLANHHGTALGFMMSVEMGGKRCYTASLPGVPSEMSPMLKNELLPLIKKTLQPDEIYKADLRFIGIPESAVDDRLVQLGIVAEMASNRGFTCIINASTNEVIVKVRDNDHQRGLTYVNALQKDLADFYIGRGEDTIVAVVLNQLAKRGWTLSVAESCTGGMLGAAFTAVSGASAVFCGGVISYDNSIKQGCLNVSADTLAKYGAVSAECAEEMAAGVAHATNTDFAISITGIAGPSGGTDAKPVGTVYIGIYMNGEISSKKYYFHDEREYVRAKSVKAALVLAYNMLKTQ